MENKTNAPDVKMFELTDMYGDTFMASLEISRYAQNGNLYIGLTSYEEDDFPEPYGDLTVNLQESLEPYLAYVDCNMPETEKVISEQKLGEATGIIKKSGYVTYKQYRFDREKLMEYNPVQTQVYESSMTKPVKRKGR